MLTLWALSVAVAFQGGVVFAAWRQIEIEKPRGGERS